MKTAVIIAPNNKKPLKWCHLKGFCCFSYWKSGMDGTRTILLYVWISISYNCKNQELS